MMMMIAEIVLPYATKIAAATAIASAPPNGSIDKIAFSKLNNVESCTPVSK